MLVKITSENTEFLSLIQKNPDSFGGLQFKEMKSGTGIGFIVGPQEYHLVFQDTKYSYSEDASNQIDFQSFCNPRVFLNLVSEFLRHLFQSKNSWFGSTIPWLGKTVEEIDHSGVKHVLEIENIYADGFRPNQGFVFEKYFPEVKMIHKMGYLYSLRIETTESIYRLLNLAALTCMYLAATNSQSFFLSTELVQKYIRIMKNLEPVPYFVIYLFAKRCIRSQEDFNKMKPELVSAFDGELELNWGNTQEMRLRVIGDRLLDENGKIPYNIVEVGCGEMDYPRRYLGKLNDGLVWWAMDLDDYSHLVPNINKKFKTNKLRFDVASNIEMRELSPKAMLMIEMIEHMPFEGAKDFVRQQLRNQMPDRALITTPNVAFNKHFGLDGNFRHEGHHFELTSEEFKDFMFEVLKEFPETFDVEFFGIGDKVNGDYLSLGVELRKKDARNI